MLLTGPDISRLAALLEMPEAGFIERHTRLASNRKQLSLLEKVDGSCEFLENGLCRVHEARPEQCRDFPDGWTVPVPCPSR